MYLNSLKTLVFTLLVLFASSLSSQGLVINEVMASNAGVLYDEDGDTPDWLELFNGGNEPINLDGFGLSDSKESRWMLPEITLNPDQHLLIYASDKDRATIPLYWETVIDSGDEWAYLVPTSEPNSSWKNRDFNTDSWNEGPSGFGYGDNDDATVLSNILSVYIRKTFDLSEVTSISEVSLDIDFDDAFVAYVNGVEVARDNITSQGAPAFDQSADNYDHEAVMYNGGNPNRYFLGNLSDLLVEGENVLALQVHNHTTASSDLTAIPFLSLGRNAPGNYETSDFLNFENIGGLHANFKISSDGETLYLTDVAGNHLDSIQTGILATDISYGRAPDGASSWTLFDEPTPGKANGSTVFSGYSNEVIFSLPGGKYPNGVQLALSSKDNDSPIYYTLDGSEPTNQAILYTSPLNVNSTTVVRAVVDNPEYLKGKIGTQSYLINDSHGNLPVVSLSTDPENLWNNETGIYVLGPNAEANIPNYGANFWNEWEIPIHVELFESDGQNGFSKDAGAKIFGGWSRANAQKSLAIHFRKSYEGPLEYPLFPAQELETYHSFVLRNGGNDWNRTMLKDGVIRTLIDEDIDQQEFRPSVVYLNGEYWGILNIREKINEDYLAVHHKLDANNIQLLEAGGSVVEGNDDHFIALRDYISSNNLTTEANYEYVKTQMDVENFIKYQVPNIFIDNIDWPGNNIKFWRNNETGSKWRWISYDREFSFNIYGGGNNHNNLEAALDPNGPDWPNPAWSTLFLRKLMMNESFKRDFLNFFADELNTRYLSGNVITQIGYHASLIENEIASHMNKWNGNVNNWQNELTKMRDFASARPGIVWSHLTAYFGLTRYQLTVANNAPDRGKVILNSLSLENNNWSGYYFFGVPVQVRAVPAKGYRFVEWEGDFSGTESDISINLVQNSTIRPIFEAIEAGSEGYPIVINEIKYQASAAFDTEDWVELLNTGSQTVDLSSWVFKDSDDSHEFVFPVNTLLGNGEYLILAQNSQRFLSATSDPTETLGDFGFGLSSTADCARIYDNEGRIQDEVCYTDEEPWPVSSEESYSIALKNRNLDNGKGENWFAIFGEGTPGKINLIDPLSTNTDFAVDFSFYPNPTGDKAILSLRNLLKQHVHIEVYDAGGKAVETIYSDYPETMDEKIVWNTSNLVKGIYLVKISATDLTKIIRVRVE